MMHFLMSKKPWKRSLGKTNYLELILTFFLVTNSRFYFFPLWQILLVLVKIHRNVIMLS